ncbi:hypothetical protein BBD41_00480 [Paenibacillus ihbetae]|uniref:Uncharacterized protein n=1 Tax=Paenibacillus ihbetae TaxID=1870820 RepID=A0A1B2DTZ6_9BACL|nr:hypothetical protein [Paenibacillus ihbetae]ANY71184.1 hypothetical protein BBD41_00480 [Paenibacillus ihbetae]
MRRILLGSKGLSVRFNLPAVSFFYKNGQSRDYIFDQFMAKNEEIMRFQKKSEDFMHGFLAECETLCPDQLEDSKNYSIKYYIISTRPNRVLTNEAEGGKRRNYQRQ